MIQYLNNSKIIQNKTIIIWTIYWSITFVNEHLLHVEHLEILRAVRTEKRAIYTSHYRRIR